MKNKVGQMTIIEIVDRRAEILSEISCVTEKKTFEFRDDAEYTGFSKGYFEIPSFTTWPSLKGKLIYSGPVIIEGAAFKMRLMLGEIGILFGIAKFRLPFSNEIECDQLSFIKLVHSSRISSNQIFCENTWDKFGWHQDKFYPVQELKKRGFVHSDGSLKFEFFVRNYDYQEKLKNLED